MCTVGAGEVAGLRERVAWLETVVRLQQRQLGLDRDECERLHGRIDRLRGENERLRARNEKLARAAKRQAAPFSRRPGGSDEGEPGRSEPEPKRSGRKPGAGYGTKAHRRRPDRVDRVIAVGLPETANSWMSSGSPSSSRPTCRRCDRS